MRNYKFSSAVFICIYQDDLTFQCVGNIFPKNSQTLSGPFHRPSPLPAEGCI